MVLVGPVLASGRALRLPRLFANAHVPPELLGAAM